MTAGLGATKCPPCADGYRRLASTLLLEALADAERGDAEAVEWLQGDGLALAETLDLVHVTCGLQQKFGGNGKMTVQKDAAKLRAQLSELETQRVALERQANQAEAQETVRQVAASIADLERKLKAAEAGAAQEREVARTALQAELATAQAEADVGNAALAAARQRLATAEAEVKDAESVLRHARHARGGQSGKIAEISNRIAQLGG